MSQFSDNQITPEKELINILSKLGVASCTEAVTLALRNHIIPSSPLFNLPQVAETNTPWSMDVIGECLA